MPDPCHTSQMPSLVERLFLSKPLGGNIGKRCDPLATFCIATRATSMLYPIAYPPSQSCSGDLLWLSAIFEHQRERCNNSHLHIQRTRFTSPTYTQLCHFRLGCDTQLVSAKATTRSARKFPYQPRDRSERIVRPPNAPMPQCLCVLENLQDCWYCWWIRRH